MGENVGSKYPPNYNPELLPANGQRSDVQPAVCLRLVHCSQTPKSSTIVISYAGTGLGLYNNEGNSIRYM